MVAAIAASAQSTERLVIDANEPSTPFPHFWEKTFALVRTDDPFAKRELSRCMSPPEYTRSKKDGFISLCLFTASRLS